MCLKFTSIDEFPQLLLTAFSSKNKHFRILGVLEIPAKWNALTSLDICPDDAETSVRDSESM